ncbi:lycopene beta-cyclase [Saccharomonospora amisosensis]|uniref:Lycopene beta-cyclase n=1 Tax=Saccharomonospora amisosensis TaxID=1128677 RepID=A0A7X5UPG8_9PSEU|nr:lycopene cyclase family protein [Saccharomonospora amisosensis]NIJ11765.1 lycopene beta-cyclase [Saccharomonospora amisosensis]
MVDVLVIGGGPAGRALAACCVRAGLSTALLDPEPGKSWPNTYAVWRDEVPDLPAEAIAARPRGTLAAGRSCSWLDREYLVVDNAGLRRWLSDDRVQQVAGTSTRVVNRPHDCVVHLSGGGTLTAGIAVDARGARPEGGGTEQTAFGVVLPASQAVRIVPGDTAVFMDWRAATAVDPSFLYAVPLGNGRVLVEETSLAARPGVSLSALSARLHKRLEVAGIDARGLPRERVRIPLDLPLPRRGRTVPFGAAAALVHPATGYSIAASLTLAPRVAEAIGEHLHSGPRAAARAAHAALWPARAVAVHAMRRYALRSLRRLPPQQVPDFFDQFFALPPHSQRAFTSAREDPAAVAAAMARLFAAAPWRLRAALVR